MSRHISGAVQLRGNILVPQVPGERAVSPVMEDRPRVSWAAEPGHTVVSRESDMVLSSALMAPRVAAPFGRKIHFILQDDSAEEPCC